MLIQYLKTATARPACYSIIREARSAARGIAQLELVYIKRDRNVAVHKLA